MRKIENHYLANIPLQNYESISLAIWSKKVQILTTKSGSVSQSSSSASFTIAFGSYPAFHIFLKQKEGKYFNERTLKAIKGNRVTSWPTPLNRSRDVLFIQPLVIHELVSLSLWRSLNAGILTIASPGILSLPSERNVFLRGAGLWKPCSSVKRRAELEFVYWLKTWGIVTFQLSLLVAVWSHLRLKQPRTVY